MLTLPLLLAGCGQAASPISGASPSQSVSKSPSTVSSPLATTPPKARSNAVWVFDPPTGKFLLFGGRYTTGNYHEFPQALGDTWTWDGANWKEVSSASPTPAARWDGVAAFDPTHGYVLLNGGSLDGETWTWNGTRWILLGPDHSPPATGIRAMAGDSSVSGVLEYQWTDPSMAAFQPAVNDLWLWNGIDWSRMTVSGPMPDHSETAGAMAYDPASHQLIFFDRLQGTPTTWTFKDNSWTRSASTAGTSSPSFVIQRDDAAGGVVLFGSNGDTWLWNGERWIPENPVHSPSARIGASLAYDSVHHVVVLFGGYTGTAAALQEHNDVWTWNGSDWTFVAGA